MGKQAQRRADTPGIIPDKLYFRIGEVASLCGVETYVLRFWQTEFPQLAPKKSGTGQRLYRRRDVEMALRIKQLLHQEGYTIAGARGVFAAEVLEQRQNALALSPAPESAESRLAREQANRQADRALARLTRLRLELDELHGILSRPPLAAAGAAYPAPSTAGSTKQGLAESLSPASFRNKSILFTNDPADGS